MKNRDKLDDAKQLINFFETILKSTTDGILIADNNGQILEANEPFCSLFNSQREEVRETNILDWISQLGNEAIKQWSHVLRTLETHKKCYNILFNTKLLGKEKYYSVNASLIDEISDEIESRIVITIWRDVTAQEKAKRIEGLLHHDIQNKNLVIYSYLELLRDGGLEEAHKKYVDSAIKTIQSSTELLLKIKKLREIKYEEGEIDVELHSILRSVIYEYTNKARGKGIKIEYTKVKTLVQGGQLLKEVFSNLIENAIKHSQCNKIRITVQEKQIIRIAIIVIEDDGIGIPDYLQDNLFYKGSRSNKSEGSGLGLYLVKQIAESYRGTIRAGKSEMGGARFEIQLKLA